ncbi:MAG: YqaJ viral recombinase family protein [Planctomycetes bacterium]|nr:YqaJ viral recombinase family protein [Planctomycetota bacterium]
MTSTATEPLNRALTLGGSDVAGVLGISPFRTPLDVWREKCLGQRDTIDTPGTRAGTRFEPHVLAAYAAKLPEGSTVTKPEPTLRGHLRASPDGIATVRGWPRLVEIKTTVFAQDWGVTDSEDVPLHYAVQAMWYLDLLELEEADFPVLLWPYEMRDLLGLTPPEIVAKCEVRTLRLGYSPSMARMLREAVDRFWNDHVLPQVPPPAVDLEDIKRLVHAVRGKTKPIDDDFVRALVERDAAKKLLAEAQRQVDAADFKVRTWMGDNESAIDPRGNQIATLKRIDKASYVVKAQSYRELRTTKHWKDLNQ